MIKKKAKLRIEFNNIGLPELESLLQYNTILSSGFLAKDGTLNTNTYYTVLEAEMCCQSVAYSNMKLHGYNHAIHHNIHENVCTDSKNSAYGYGESNCQQINVNTTKDKVCVSMSYYVNNCLNVEAPCFLDSLYEDYNFNIFSPVFVPKVNSNSNMQSVNINLPRKGDTRTNDMCGYMKGCTNGFETKNQTLAHNILISSLDGDPSCGGDIFHNTCSHQQFEYKVENHQILSASNINITSSVTDARVSVKASVVKTNLSYYDNSSSVLLHELKSGKILIGKKH